MTAADLLRQVRADGLAVRVTERGTLKVSGDPATLDRWAPTLKANKPALLAVLTAADTDERKPCALNGSALSQLGSTGTDLERRQGFVVRELEDHPELHVSTHVNNVPVRPEPGEPVSVVIAIRTEAAAIVTAEFFVPRDRFDFVLFSKMLDETSRRPS